MMIDHAERANIILHDLVDYTGKEAELVRNRCKYSTEEMVWQWDHFKDNPLAFYRTTDLYIFDLTKYQSIMVPTVNYMVDEANNKQMAKILDLGGGIGEYTIRFLKESECRDRTLTYLDLEGSKTVEYAKYRFKRHGVEPKVVSEVYDWHAEKWDAVIAMDVLEHMTGDVAMKALEAMRENVKYLFCNPEQLQYNKYYPQHITHFELEGFERVDLNLYKNKAL